MRFAASIAALLAALLVVPTVASSEGFGFGCEHGRESGKSFGKAFGSPPGCHGNAAPTLIATLSDESADVDEGVAIGPFECDDDGLPDPPGDLAYHCVATGGAGACTFDFPGESQVVAECDDAGEYTITCTCCDNAFSGDTCTGLSASDESIFTVGSAFAGVIDNIITAGGTAANFCASVSHRLYSAYTGYLFLAQRVADDATQEIGYGGDNLLDQSVLASFCGASDCVIKTLHDQCGSARDVTQTVEAAMPKIYDGTTGIVLQGSLPWATFDGDDRWTRGDSSGVTGVEPITFAHFSSFTSYPSAYAITLSVGASSANQYFLAGAHSAGRPLNMVSLSGRRHFTASSALSSPSLLVHQLAGGGTVGASTVRQDGTSLVEQSVSNGSETTTLGTSFTALGTFFAGDLFFVGGGCYWILDDVEYTGGVLTALEDFGDALEMLD